MAGVPRYALYVVPRPESALARFSAAWLGWDIERGESIDDFGSELHSRSLFLGRDTAIGVLPRAQLIDGRFEL